MDWSDKAFENLNNHSVVTKVTLDKASIVITGDLELEGIAALLERQHAALAADAYEVGHHGSYNATTKELLDAIAPKLALIGMGSMERQTTWTAWAYARPRCAWCIENAVAQLAGVAICAATRGPGALRTHAAASSRDLGPPTRARRCVRWLRCSLPIRSPPKVIRCCMRGCSSM